MTSPLNPAALPDTTPPFWTDATTAGSIAAAGVFTADVDNVQVPNWTDTLVADTVESYYGFGTYSFTELPFAGSDIVQFLPDTVGWAQIDNTQTV